MYNFLYKVNVKTLDNQDKKRKPLLHRVTFLLFLVSQVNKPNIKHDYQFCFCQ